MDYFDPDEDERPRGKFSGLVSTHDHVGCMEYSESKASCSGCGQVWRLKARGDWVAEHFPDGERHRPTYRRGMKTNPNLSQVGRFTYEQESLRASVIARWEEMGLLAPDWRIGPSSSAA